MAGSPGGKEVGRLALKVLPDTSGFGDELQAFAERIEEQVKIELKVELDSASAQLELERLQQQMEAAELSLDIGTELDGAGAMAHLDILLDAMQGTADLNPIHIDTEIDVTEAAAEMAAMNTAMQFGTSGAGSMGRNIAMWGPLIGLALVGIAAIAPALLVLFPLVGGLALGIGAIITGVNGLRDVLEPIVFAWQDMRKEIGLTLTSGLKPLISEFVSGFMPALADGLGLFAGLFNSLAKGLLGFLGSTEGIELFRDVIGQLAAAFRPFAVMVGPATELFLRLVLAGAPALELIGRTLLRLTEDLNDWFAAADRSDAVVASVSQIGEVLAIIGQLAADAFPTLLAAVGPTLSVLKGVGGALGMMFKVLKPLFQYVATNSAGLEILGVMLTVLAVGFAVVTGAVAAFNLVMAVNPIALVVIAIAALVAAIIYAYQNFEGFRNVVDTVFAALKAAVTTVIGFIIEHWKLFAAIILLPITPLIALVAFVIANFSTIRDFIVGVFNFLKTALLIALTVIVTIFRTQFTIAKTVVTTVFAAISAVVRAGIATVKGIVAGISAVGTFIRNAFNDGKNAAKAAIDKIVSLVTGLPAKITEALGDLSSLLVSAGKDLIGGLIDGIKSKIGGVKDTLTGLTGSLTKWKGPESLDKVILFDAGSLIMQGFINGLESEYGAVEKSLGGFTDSLADTAAFSATASLTGSVASAPLLRALDGALTSPDATGGAQRFVIEDWRTGVGFFDEIAKDKVAALHASAATQTRMGVPA